MSARFNRFTMLTVTNAFSESKMLYFDDNVNTEKSAILTCKGKVKPLWEQRSCSLFQNTFVISNCKIPVLEIILYLYQIYHTVVYYLMHGIHFPAQVYAQIYYSKWKTSFYHILIHGYYCEASIIIQWLNSPNLVH